MPYNYGISAPQSFDPQYMEGFSISLASGRTISFSPSLLFGIFDATQNETFDVVLFAKAIRDKHGVTLKEAKDFTDLVRALAATMFVSRRPIYDSVTLVYNCTWNV